MISAEWKPVQSLFGLPTDTHSQHVVAKQRAASPEAMHHFNNIELTKISTWLQQPWATSVEKNNKTNFDGV